MTANAKVPAKLTKARAEKLRAAWFGPYSLAVVAHQHGLASWQAVRTFWMAEQAAGRLPAGDRADDARLGVMQAGEVAAATIIYCDLDDEPDDGFGARIPEGDPLLARLRYVHGDDPLRRPYLDHSLPQRPPQLISRDDMPSQTLGLEFPYTPSASRCREMRIARDAWAAAQIAAGKVAAS